MKQFKALRPAKITRSNTSIARDFMALSFQLENGAELPYFTRFEGPITLRVIGQNIPETLNLDLTELLGRLRAEAGIDIQQVAPNVDANITIQTLPHAALLRRAPNAACVVAPNVSSWNALNRTRRADLNWNALTRRERLSIFIPDDEAPQEVRDCLHEELAQALGPLNDLYRLTDSVFNDDNFHSVLTEFDMLVLKATYAPELQNGMTRAEVESALPSLLARLNPSGGKVSSLSDEALPRKWIKDIEAAMGGKTRRKARITAAKRAVAFAQSQGWTDNRKALSLFLLGRLTVYADPETAEGALNEAYSLYAAQRATRYQSAHVAHQLVILALKDRDYDAALRLTKRAIPIARESGNAALLASLMLAQSDALTATGQTAMASRVWLDSLGWARYGFGTAPLVAAVSSEYVRFKQP